MIKMEMVLKYKVLHPDNIGWNDSKFFIYKKKK